MTVPGFWMHETSGILAPVVRKFIEGGELDAAEVAIMRAYFRQWMAGDFRGAAAETLRRDVDAITTHDDVKAWLWRAVDEGMDPL